MSSAVSEGSATAIHIMRRSAGWHPATRCRDAFELGGSAPAGHWRVPAASLEERRLSRACRGGGSVRQGGVVRGRTAAGDM